MEVPGTDASRMIMTAQAGFNPRKSVDLPQATADETQQV